MINLMLGPSGGGKSYESCVFHVLPALQRGRQVITNLPLNLPMWHALFPENAHLLKIVEGEWGEKFDVKTQKSVRVFIPAFTLLKDYPQGNDSAEVGPLIVIDECHKSLPVRDTARDVEEWYAEHRHARCDVLLITQSYGKISAAIRDNVQLMYRCKKAVAFGSTKKYIRKVFDGIRGDNVNTAIRSYDKKFFSLYRSHTKGAEGLEAGASDVVPIWRRWPFIGTAIAAVVFFALIPFLENPFSNKKASAAAAKRAAKVAEAKAAAVPVPAIVPPSSSSTVPAPAAIVPAVVEPSLPIEPYGTKGLHYQGKMTLAGRIVHLFGVSQNAQPIGSVTSLELEAAGYRVRIVGECTGWLYYGKTERPVVCDSGQVTVGGGSSTHRGEGEGPASAGGTATPSARAASRATSL